MNQAENYHETILRWAKDNGFGDPCGCSGLCAHQRFAAETPTRHEIQAGDQNLHDRLNMPCSQKPTRYYFWVGATPAAGSLEELAEALIPLVSLLQGAGVSLAVQSLANCGAEFVPTRLPCEVIILRAGVPSELQKCLLCEVPAGQHELRAPN